eukprot:65818_1
MLEDRRNAMVEISPCGLNGVLHSPVDPSETSKKSPSSSSSSIELYFCNWFACTVEFQAKIRDYFAPSDWEFREAIRKHGGEPSSLNRVEEGIYSCDFDDWCWMEHFIEKINALKLSISTVPFVVSATPNCSETFTDVENRLDTSFPDAEANFGLLPKGERADTLVLYSVPVGWLGISDPASIDPMSPGTNEMIEKLLGKFGSIIRWDCDVSASPANQVADSVQEVDIYVQYAQFLSLFKCLKHCHGKVLKRRGASYVCRCAASFDRSGFLSSVECRRRKWARSEHAKLKLAEALERHKRQEVEKKRKSEEARKKREQELADLRRRKEEKQRQEEERKRKVEERQRLEEERRKQEAEKTRIEEIERKRAEKDRIRNEQEEGVRREQELKEHRESERANLESECRKKLASLRKRRRILLKQLACAKRQRKEGSLRELALKSAEKFQRWKPEDSDDDDDT